MLFNYCNKCDIVSCLKQEAFTMNKVDRQAVIQLVEDKRITNIAIITYFSAIAMSKFDEEIGYPVIDRFTTYKLYKNMADKMSYINESSVRLAVHRLVEQGFFAYLDEEKTKLAIINSGSGHIKSDEHFKSKGYITLHHCLFSRTFFDISLRTKKLALLVMCRLNNCSVKPVNLNFKSMKNPESFEYYCKTLKINRLAHINYILDELKSLFHIVKLSNNTVQFSLNTVSKAILSGTDKLFRFTQVQLSKTEKMLKEVNKNNLNFKPQQVQEICEAICGYNMSLGRRVLKELCKCNRSGVKNFLGYTQSILKRISSVA